MELIIGYTTTVDDVLMQFNALYPFLQLQVYSSLPTWHKSIQKLVKMPPGQLIKTWAPTHSQVSLSIENKITVAQLVDSLKAIGLRARVSRKSGNQWIETSLTDDWTLEQQNREAMQISIPQESISTMRASISPDDK